MLSGHANNPFGFFIAKLNQLQPENKRNIFKNFYGKHFIPSMNEISSYSFGFMRFIHTSDQHVSVKFLNQAELEDSFRTSLLGKLKHLYLEDGIDEVISTPELAKLFNEFSIVGTTLMLVNYELHLPHPSAGLLKSCGYILKNYGLQGFLRGSIPALAGCIGIVIIDDIIASLAAALNHVDRSEIDTSTSIYTAIISATIAAFALRPASVISDKLQHSELSLREAVKTTSCRGLYKGAALTAVFSMFSSLSSSIPKLLKKQNLSPLSSTNDNDLLFRM